MATRPLTPNTPRSPTESLIGKALWQIAGTSGRVAPTVSTAWHGAVHGITTNGAVILDARTGADRVDLPGAAPQVVDGYVGLTDMQPGLDANRAIG